MRAILIIMLLHCYNISLSQGCLKADVMLVVDLSGSVSEDYKFLGDAVETFVSRFELSETGMRIGMVYFNTIPFMISNLTTDKSQLYAAAKRENILELISGTTYMSGALDVAADHLLGNQRPGALKVIVLISDGDADNRDKTMSIARDIRNVFNIHVVSIMVQNNYSREAFMYLISDQLHTANIEELANELEGLDICP